MESASWGWHVYRDGGALEVSTMTNLAALSHAQSKSALLGRHRLHDPHRRSGFNGAPKSKS